MKIYKAGSREEADAITRQLCMISKTPIYMAPDFWLNSQFSVAKYYGGMTYNDVRYQIDYNTGDLVRSDCYGIYTKFYKNDRPKLKEAEKQCE